MYSQLCRALDRAQCDGEPARLLTAHADLHRCIVQHATLLNDLNALLG